MRVIADLHGGDLEDPVAKAEFREIKDKVIADVCDSSEVHWHEKSDICPTCSASQGRNVATPTCGRDTNEESCWPCRRKLSLSW